MSDNKCALTVCSYRGEGLGSVLSVSILNAYALARRLGCYYLHTPVNEVRWTNKKEGHDPDTDHAFNQYILNCLLPKSGVLSIRGWARYQRHLKNDRFSSILEDSEYRVYHETSTENWIPGDEIEYLDVPIDPDAIKKIIQTPSSKHRVLRINDGDNTYRLPNLPGRMAMIEDIHADLLENYIHSPHLPDTYFSSQEQNVAIHIRKFCSPPDYSGVGANLFSLGNQIDQFYCSYIRNTSESISDRPLAFHIYGHASDDQVSEFEHFKDCTTCGNHRVVLHINEHPITTFHHFIMADIFLMGYSSMSYAAHFYARGIIESPCKWHPCLSHVRFI